LAPKREDFRVFPSKALSREGVPREEISGKPKSPGCSAGEPTRKLSGLESLLER
jgi:hypothetical protein